MTTLAKAIAIAAEAHADQVDKGGETYIFHPLRVMMACKAEDRAVAVLHDVAEDCAEWPVWRIAMEMGWTDNSPEREALTALTRAEHENYSAFIKRVAKSPIARRVKLADLDDNMNTRRLPRPLTDADVARIGKYERAFNALTKATTTSEA